MVTWTKNGQPLDPKRVNIRSTERDSILFIRASERDDSGVYEMCVKVDDFDDKANLTLQIVGESNVEIAFLEKKWSYNSFVVAVSKSDVASCFGKLF